ncbi:RagB/SusD family nutrient uptake outer membrane protein [Pedobacter nutrimenti]|uniref:RagB/SusD family nutrient uptake outer membrane protein n=1 Tax=Pedobacter nutrimenti TaxID=1241337 RepID=UPI002931DADC|nr:RagB/SusD family nutrient uptake outer membrane protein [Pedobacter nutrimenti]
METKLTFYSKSVILLSLLLLAACKKFAEIPPPANQIVSSTAFADDKSAVATLNGIYSKMSGTSLSICSSAACLYPAMSADELAYYTASSRDNFIKNTLDPIANNVELATYLWTPAYNFIYGANSCLEGVAQSESLSSDTKNMVMGEAYLMRAFMYFNLVNLFGDVPMVTTTDYEINKSLARTPQEQIYQLIMSDLQKAISLLQTAYPSPGRARPNKVTAQALLAKVYLYQNKWPEAAALCDAVIGDSRYALEQDLSKVFLSSSQEAIWQLAPVIANINTYIGNLILPSSSSAAPTYLLTGSLLNDFEAGDKRKTTWVQSRVYRNETLYYPFKYRIRTGTSVTEYMMVLRLGEIYLIRAEARAKLGNLEGARSDLNVIRRRAGLGDLSENLDQTGVTKALWHERRIELFSEWGNRWFDLKRIGLANAVIGGLKPDTWKTTAQFYPIPNSQMITNPQLQQNNGY